MTRVFLVLLVIVSLVAWLLKRHHGDWKVVLAVGTALAGSLFARRTDVAKSLLPDWFWDLALYGGLVFVALGILGIFLPVEEGTKWLRALRKERYYSSRPAKFSELATVRELAAKLIDPGISALQLMQRWHKKNARLFWLIHERQGGPLSQRRRLVGFFSVFPLTAAAAALVEAERLNGAALDPEHISDTRQPAKALYIGSVAAKHGRAKVAAMAELQVRVRRPLKQNVPIYTRPVTKRGLQLVNDFNFEPVNPTVAGNTLNRIYVKKG